MIRAVIFDLDGTLVQTERLKATSYARAAMELCPYEVTEEAVIEAYKDVVGLPRHKVASALLERFDLERASRARMDDYSVSASLAGLCAGAARLLRGHISDPELLRDNQWPHNRELLRVAQETGCRIALATMSGRHRTQQVLEALRLTDAFDFVATRDDVERGKPDPEIYYLVCKQLAVPSSQSLAIEDSPAGVEAALAADLRCIAVTTPFTREKIHKQGLLEPKWIVDDSARLPGMARDLIEGSKQA